MKFWYLYYWVYESQHSDTLSVGLTACEAYFVINKIHVLKSREDRLLQKIIEKGDCKPYAMVIQGSLSLWTFSHSVSMQEYIQSEVLLVLF